MDEREQDKIKREKEMDSGEYVLVMGPDGRFRLKTSGKRGGRRFEADSVDATQDPKEPIRETLKRMAKKSPPPPPPKPPGTK